MYIGQAMEELKHSLPCVFISEKSIFLKMVPAAAY